MKATLENLSNRPIPLFQIIVAVETVPIYRDNEYRGERKNISSAVTRMPFNGKAFRHIYVYICDDNLRHRVPPATLCARVRLIAYALVRLYTTVARRVEYNCNLLFGVTKGRGERKEIMLLDFTSADVFFF